MLTKQDLNAIGNLIDERLESKLESKFQEKLTPIHNDIKNLQKDMTTVKKGVHKLRKDLTKTIYFFDKADLSTREKVNKTRSELGLQEVTFAY